MRGINEKTCFLFVIPSFYTFAIRHQMQPYEESEDLRHQKSPVR